METTMNTKVYDWFNDNHGDDPCAGKINPDITFGELDYLLKGNIHPDRVIFADGHGDTEARDYVLDCLNEIRFQEGMRKVFDSLNAIISETMPNGWSVRNMCCGCVYLECRGMASSLELRLHDDHPNDFSMNLCGAGTFWANEPSCVRDYYLGASELMTNQRLHDAVLSALAESDRLTDAYVEGRVAMM